MSAFPCIYPKASANYWQGAISVTKTRTNYLPLSLITCVNITNVTSYTIIRELETARTFLLKSHQFLKQRLKSVKFRCSGRMGFFSIPRIVKEKSENKISGKTLYFNWYMHVFNLIGEVSVKLVYFLKNVLLYFIAWFRQVCM